MKIFTFLFLITAFESNAQAPKPFSESFYMISSKCSVSIVEMNSGDLKNTFGDDFSLACELVKDKLDLKCTFYHKNNATKEVTYTGGIMGSDAVISGKNIEQFNINMVTRKFQSDSYIYLDNGRIRGMKICSGDFIYVSEANKLSKKKK